MDFHDLSPSFAERAGDLPQRKFTSRVREAPLASLGIGRRLKTNNNSVYRFHFC
jgi:hypothetical protein